MKIETKELTAVRGQVSKAVSAAEALVVKENKDLTVATELLSRIKAVGSLIKEKKEGITKPLNKALKNARDLFRPLEDAWATAEQIVKEKMVAYSNEVEEKNRIEQEKIAKKVEEGKMKFETAAKKVEALEKVEPVSSKSGTAEFREISEIVIENISLIPDEYWVVDDVKVRKDALSGIQIPGVKVVKKKIVASYSKQTEEYAGKLSKK